MPFLKGVLRFILYVFTATWQVISAILRFFFGSINYQAPAWMQWCGARLGKLFVKATVNPVKSLGIIALQPRWDGAAGKAMLGIRRNQNQLK